MHIVPSVREKMFVPTNIIFVSFMLQIVLTADFEIGKLYKSFYST